MVMATLSYHLVPWIERWSDASCGLPRRVIRGAVQHVAGRDDRIALPSVDPPPRSRRSEVPRRDDVRRDRRGVQLDPRGTQVRTVDPPDAVPGRPWGQGVTGRWQPGTELPVELDARRDREEHGG